MKVYIAITDDGDYPLILKVFANEELGNKYCKECSEKDKRRVPFNRYKFVNSYYLKEWYVED